MKTKLLFLFAFATFTFTVNAQIIEDDFEFYTLGDMGLQNPTVWSVWNGDPAAGGGIIVGEGNGGQVGYIGPNSTQDALLLLGNETSGDYYVAFNMFIPAANTGYFNVQGQTETNAGTGYEGAGDGGAGIFNSGNLYFNQDGANPGVFVDEATGETGAYPEDEWFPFQFYFDLDSLTYVITLDGTTVHSAPVPFQGDTTLGAIDFFSIDANNNYYIDDVLYILNSFGFDDFSNNNFKLYPNPVTDILNIQSVALVSEIEVHNIVGKKVLSAKPNGISPSIDMSALSSGVYLVTFTIDNAVKTFKVVK